MTDAYWNHRRRLWSIREGGCVIGHEAEVCLLDVRLVVSRSAIARVRLRGQREVVCAWASGRRVAPRRLGGEEVGLSFNPYRDDAFLDDWDRPVTGCSVLILQAFEDGSNVAWAEGLVEAEPCR
ncbi:hypothetical protein [Methylorubrum aminovorans]